MSRLRRIFIRVFAIPSTNHALFLVVMCPVVYVNASWESSQLPEYLEAVGIHLRVIQEHDNVG
jgi:hypothetical protein